MCALTGKEIQKRKDKEEIWMPKGSLSEQSKQGTSKSYASSTRAKLQVGKRLRRVALLKWDRTEFPFWITADEQKY